MLDDTLIYATQGWVDDNYVPRDEIIDNLVTNDPTKPLSAKQGKIYKIISLIKLLMQLVFRLKIIEH